MRGRAVLTQPTLIPAPPTDAQLAVQWAADVAADPAAVFLDTETTGLGPDAEICDVAVVSVDGTVLLDELVRPWRGIPAVATGVHGITEAMVLDRPFFEDLAPRLRSLLHGRRVVVYNAEYDAGVVTGLCKRIPKCPDIVWDWECAMKAYGAFHGAKSPKGGYRWHKLDAAAAHFGFQPGGHRALADAEVCRKVVLAMAEGAR